MKSIAPILLSISLLGAIAAQSSLARPLVPAEKRYRPFTANLPACDDKGVLDRITDRFQQKESLYWKSTLEIVAFDKVRESGFRTNGLDYIPRRYCEARATLNDRKLHHVTYWIGENLGIIGYGYGVEWCVGGLDRNNAFAPACREARH